VLLRLSGRKAGAAPRREPARPPGGGPLLPVLSTSTLALLLAAAAPLRAEAPADVELEEPVGLVVVVEEPGNDDTDPASTSATVTVIDVDETLPASADVAAVVDSASGTVVRRFGGLGDYATVSIRGSSARQVQVFLDGVPLNPDGSQAVNLSELPLSAFERVEIFRGGAPAELAAAPIGGVINLVTGEVPTVGSVAYGSHDTGRLVGATGVPGPLSLIQRRRAEEGAPSPRLEDSLLIMAELFTTQGNFEAFDDQATLYDEDDDAWVLRENNDKAQLATLARWRLEGPGLELSLNDAFLGREEGLPGPISTPTTSARLATVRNLASGKLQGHWGSWRASGLLWHQLRDETVDDRLGEVGVGEQWDRYRTSNIGGTGHLSWGARSWLVPSLTLTGRHDGFVEQDLLAGTVEDPRRRTVASGAASASLRLFRERLQLEPVLQATWLDNRMLGAAPAGSETVAGGQEQAWEATPRLGLLLRPWRPVGAEADDPWAGLAFKANAGRFFRPPDFTELFGDRGAVTGNPELRPERGWQWDVGGRWALPADGELTGSVDLAHFWSAVEDQIVFVQNGQHSSVPINLGRSWTQGLEAALVLDALGWVDSQSNLTWTLSRNLTPRQDVADKQLPRVPTWEVHQGTSVHWDDRLRLGHSWSYTSGTYLDETNWFLAPPRSIHGAFLRLGVGGLSVELSVLNLLDRRTALVDRNPLSDQDDTLVTQALTDFFGYPLPGRSYLLTVAWAEPPRDEP
jgi:outer membrane receptor protein involved in Fe transport